MKLTVPKSLRGQRGSTLIYLLVFGTLMSIAGLMLPRVIQRQMTFSADDRMKFEAAIVAQNLVETGKWLMLYEKVFYQENPMKLRGAGNASRAQCLQSMWSQHFGAISNQNGDIRNACGFYDMAGRYQGSNDIICPAPLNVDEPAVCPAMLRSELMSGAMMQDLVLTRWGEGTLLDPPIFRQDTPGVFSLDIDMNSALDPDDQDTNVFPLNYGERFLTQVFDSAFGALNDDFEANLRIELLSNSANFIANASERFVRIIGQITFTGNRGMRYRVQREQVLMITPSTARDFALFLSYPAVVSPPASYGNLTNRFSQAVTGTSANVSIFGRTFFHGDIDTALPNLPIFEQAVVISGTVNPGGAIPGPSDANIALMKSRFKRGIVTNFPSERYIFQGDCSGTMISPGTDLLCPRNVAQAAPPRPRQTIKEYVLGVGQCAHMITDVSCGSYQRRRFTDQQCIARGLNCIGQCESDLVPTNTAVDFLKEGRGRVNLNGSGTCAAVMAPGIEFNVQGGSNIYGLMLGGHVRFAPGGAKLYSISSLHGGLPGVNDPAAFGGQPSSVGDFNFAAVEAYGGVSFPLNNLPVVMVTGGETQ